MTSITNKRRAAPIEVKIGQIWQRNDYLNGEMLPNQGFVKIEKVGGERVTFVACDSDGSDAEIWPGSKKQRVGMAQTKRFGRRGGYRLHKDIGQ